MIYAFGEPVGLPVFSKAGALVVMRTKKNACLFAEADTERVTADATEKGLPDTHEFDALTARVADQVTTIVEVQVRI